MQARQVQALGVVGLRKAWIFDILLLTPLARTYLWQIAEERSSIEYRC